MLQIIKNVLGKQALQEFQQLLVTAHFVDGKAQSLGITPKMAKQNIKKSR